MSLLFSNLAMEEYLEEKAAIERKYGSYDNYLEIQAQERKDKWEASPYKTSIEITADKKYRQYSIISHYTNNILDPELMCDALMAISAYHFGCKPTLIINPTLLPQMNGLDNYYGYGVEYDSEMKEQGLIVVKED